MRLASFIRSPFREGRQTKPSGIQPRKNYHENRQKQSNPIHVRDGHPTRAGSSEPQTCGRCWSATGKPLFARASTSLTESAISSPKSPTLQIAFSASKQTNHHENKPRQTTYAVRESARGLRHQPTQTIRSNPHLHATKPRLCHH